MLITDRNLFCSLCLSKCFSLPLFLLLHFSFSLSISASLSLSLSLLPFQFNFVQLYWYDSGIIYLYCYKCCTLLVTFLFNFSIYLSFAKCLDNYHKCNICTISYTFVLYLCVNASICEAGIIWVCSLFSLLNEGHSSFNLKCVQTVIKTQVRMKPSLVLNGGAELILMEWSRMLQRGVMQVLYIHILTVFCEHSRFIRVLYGIYSSNSLDAQLDGVDSSFLYLVLSTTPIPPLLSYFFIFM